MSDKKLPAVRRAISNLDEPAVVASQLDVPGLTSREVVVACRHLADLGEAEAGSSWSTKDDGPDTIIKRLTASGIEALEAGSVGGKIADVSRGAGKRAVDILAGAAIVAE